MQQQSACKTPSTRVSGYRSSDSKSTIKGYDITLRKETRFRGYRRLFGICAIWRHGSSMVPVFLWLPNLFHYALYWGCATTIIRESSIKYHILQFLNQINLANRVYIKKDNMKQTILTPRKDHKKCHQKNKEIKPVTKSSWYPQLQAIAP
jgi:hypothetical protein